MIRRIMNWLRYGGLEYREREADMAIIRLDEGVARDLGIDVRERLREHRDALRGEDYQRWYRGRMS